MALDRQHLGEVPGQALSVTQAEALAAAQTGIPLFAFVDAGVYHDHSVFERNRGKPFAKEIGYPSISQEGTAEYIFDFIDYLRGRSFNNAVVPFDRLEDVLSHLQKQWAGLFQRMLAEDRAGHDESKRIDRLADQFEDLKAALLATVGGDAANRSVAKWVIRARRLFDFLRALPNTGRPMREAFIAGDCGFRELLQQTAGVVSLEEYRPAIRRDLPYRPGALLRMAEGRDLVARFSMAALERIERDWQDMRQLSPGDREIVFDALLETHDRVSPMPLVQPVARQHEDEDPETGEASTTAVDLVEAFRKSVEAAKRGAGGPVPDGGADPPPGLSGHVND